MNRLPTASIELVKRVEGLRLTAYYCPAGKPTIGYGHTGPDVTDDDVRRGKRISAAVAEAILITDLSECQEAVLSCCRVAPNDNQLGAMVSLAFNIGMGWQGRKNPGDKDGFRQSSVLKAHNRGDFEAAARAFNLWNKATVNGNKVVLPGLVSRRAAEAALYLAPAADFAERMPQVVEPEKPLVESNIVRGGALAGTASALGLMSEVARSVADIRTNLGDLLPYVALGVAVICAGWVVWERIRQRREGWA